MNRFILVVTVIFITVTTISCKTLNQKKQIFFDLEFNALDRFKGIVKDKNEIQFYFIKDNFPQKIIFYNLEGKLVDSIFLKREIDISKTTAGIISKDNILFISNFLKTIYFMDKNGIIYNTVNYNDILSLKSKNYNMYIHNQRSIVDIKSKNFFINVMNNNYNKKLYSDIKEYRLELSRGPQFLKLDFMNKKNLIFSNLVLEGVFLNKETLDEQIVFPFQHKTLIINNENIAYSAHSNNIFYFDENMNIYKEKQILNKSIYQGSLDYINEILYDDFSNKYAVVVFQVDKLSEDFGLFNVGIINCEIYIYKNDFILDKKISIDINKYNPNVIFLINNKLYVEKLNSEYGKIEYKKIDI